MTWKEFLIKQAKADSELTPREYTLRNLNDPAYMERQFHGWREDD